MASVKLVLNKRAIQTNNESSRQAMEKRGGRYKRLQNTRRRLEAMQKGWKIDAHRTRTLTIHPAFWAGEEVQFTSLEAMQK